MTKYEIALRLQVLAFDMENIAVEMDCYGGFAPWAQHSKALQGAAGMAMEWAGEIIKETEQTEGNEHANV